MEINFETILPLQNMSVQELRDYRVIAKYMHNRKILDKINRDNIYNSYFDRIHFLNVHFPHLKDKIQTYLKYAHITPKPNTRNAVCVMGIQPSFDWVIIANHVLKDYDVFYISDRPIEAEKYFLMLENKGNVHFIHIDSLDAVKMSFRRITALGSTTARLFEAMDRWACGAWEKALLYFSCVNLHYEHVWFLEDDCILFNQENLVTFDQSRNRNSDFLKLLPGDNQVPEWNWVRRDSIAVNNAPRMPPEDWRFSWVYFTRFSKKMLNSIYEYCTYWDCGMYLEMFFASLASHLPDHEVCILHQNSRLGRNNNYLAWEDDEGNVRDISCGGPTVNIDFHHIHKTKCLAIYHHAKHPHRRMEFIHHFLRLGPRFLDKEKMIRQEKYKKYIEDNDL